MHASTRCHVTRVLGGVMRVGQWTEHWTCLMCHAEPVKHQTR
jgi:hypothetical protein